jgi:hypothetical protein
VTNSTPRTPVPFGPGASPFGDDGPADTTGDRLPAILEGNEAQLAEAVVHMVVVGGGLLASGTRDGGAIGLHVFYGRNKWSKYAASPEALSALLEAISHWEPKTPVPVALRPSQTRQAPR